MTLSEAHILVVDDEVALREIFAKWLRKSGCQDVRTASNGEEALQQVERAEVDVLITDVRMPVMDGVTLIRELARRGHFIPCIIFVSGFGDVDQREMYDLGVEAFLAKPFHMEELAGAIEHAIAERQTLWLKPMAIAPRQEVEMRIELAGSHSKVNSSECPQAEQTAECFRLGRGGFSARSPDALGLGKIAFRCEFDSDHPALSGQGYVRWRSRTDHTVGIEFAFLHSPGREWVIGQIEEEKPRSFIPAL